MRQLIECAGAQDFQTRVWALLLEREAENNLIIGLAGRWAQPLATGKITKADRPRFWAVMENDHVVAAAMMTPPHRIILTRMSAAVVKFLVRELWRIETILPGVVGPTEVAHGFATQWCRRKKRSIQPGLAMRIYQLDRVTPVAAVPGRLVIARETDLDCVVGWSDAFWRETGMLLAPGTAELRQMICAGQIAFWRKSKPVAMAAAVGPTPNGIRINMVYTSPVSRRQGYATALVAALSQQLLDAGRRFCFLFTDLANPTSNSIYQKIGYRPVCDFAECDFVEPTLDGLCHAVSIPPDVRCGTQDGDRLGARVTPAP